MQYKYYIESVEFPIHADVVERIMKNPELISEDFKPIAMESICLRGKVDIIGKLGEDYCLVEVKTANESAIMIKAKQQLEKYSYYINYYFRIFKRPEIKFKFVIVRKLNSIFKINIYDDLNDMKNDKYILGLGYPSREAEEKCKPSELPRSKDELIETNSLR